ncbi:hypothetical protein BC833DRAFT_564879 [Globomyces pollinis-pini]|nr:hypothetical protein BC833DRAFT_564879 [Globomyces pollinis-pini]
MEELKEKYTCLFSVLEDTKKEVLKRNRSNTEPQKQALSKKFWSTVDRFGGLHIDYVHVEFISIQELCQARRDQFFYRVYWLCKMADSSKDDINEAGRWQMNCQQRVYGAGELNFKGLKQKMSKNNCRHLKNYNNKYGLGWCLILCFWSLTSVDLAF